MDGLGEIVRWEKVVGLKLMDGSGDKAGDKLVLISSLVSFPPVPVTAPLSATIEVGAGAFCWVGDVTPASFT